MKAWIRISGATPGPWSWGPAGGVVRLLLVVVLEPPGEVLLDAGEGVSAVLRNMVFGIESVFITHGHYDHIGGLPGLIRSRTSSRGDQSKALTIYYPEKNAGVMQIRRYLTESSGKLPFELCWQGLEPGQEIALPGGERKQRWIEPFQVEHSPGRLCFGYRIMEARRRLRPQFQGLFREEIIKIKREQGEEALTEEYKKNLVCYSGDCMPLDADLARDAEVLMHDATFVAPEDREQEYHATVREAVQVAKDAEVGSLVLYHFSTRYQRTEILKEISKSIKEAALEAPVCYVNPYALPNTRIRKLEER